VIGELEVSAISSETGTDPGNWGAQAIVTEKTPPLNGVPAPGNDFDVALDITGVPRARSSNIPSS
jgi:hypothetical protein